MLYLKRDANAEQAEATAKEHDNDKHAGQPTATIEPTDNERGLFFVYCSECGEQPDESVYEFAEWLKGKYPGCEN